MIVNITTTIVPDNPRPTYIPSLKVNTHWRVDDDEWAESDLASLYDADQSAPATIDGFDMELDFGVYMMDPDADSIIEEFCAAFGEFAESLIYCLEHEDEYDGYEDALLEEWDFQCDPNIVEGVCQVLYGHSAQEMDVDALFALAKTSNWSEICNRTFSFS